MTSTLSPVTSNELLSAARSRGVSVINQIQALEIISARAPQGLFVLPEADGTYTTIDNESGDAWTENFPNRETAVWWLEGDYD